MTGRSGPSGQTTYEWDDDNRLTKVVTQNKGVVTYTYDYAGRKIERNDNGKITRYVYDDNRVIAETDANGAITSTYLYGPGLDEILQGQAGNTVYYYNYDGLGSVSDIADSNGSTVEKYEYDIWGNLTIKDVKGAKLDRTTAENNNYFTGREYDATTGLYNYRARWYDPKIGRFLSADPIGYKGGINVYAYCQNNPVNRIDPFGLACACGCGCPCHGLVEILSRKVVRGKVHLLIKISQGDKITTCEIGGYLIPNVIKPVPIINKPGTLTNPRNTGNVYPVNIPQGMTSQQFVANIQNQVAKGKDNLPNYVATGPNSNTFVDNVIEGAGGKMPDVTGAVGQNYGEDATGPVN